MKENDSSIDSVKTIGLSEPPEMCARSLASAHARGGDGVERETLMDGETIIPLEGKPVRPKTTIKNHQTLNIATEVTETPLNGLSPIETKAMSSKAIRYPLRPIYDKRLDFFQRSELKRAWADFLYSLNGVWDWYGHLTFKDPVHPESADKLFNIMMNKLNREIHGKRFKNKPATGVLWAKATEKQKRDVLHFHFLCGGIPNWVQRTDYWQWWFDHAGRNQIVPYEKELGAGFYMAKYVGKEGEIELGGNVKLVSFLEVQDSLLLR